ncbi:YkvA family protein [Actinomadura scrupuli]|uniref:YkvA family protein n=1 Tax=Actinomadura scrupuli TaxID=559629 RepID=UPI003D989A83
MDKTRRTAAAGQAWQIYSETRAPGAPGLRERFTSIPRMLKAVMRGHYKGFGAGKVGLLVFGLIYILSPIDAVPEFLPFIGVADDLGVAMWLLATLVGATGEFVQWERSRPPVVKADVLREPV